MYAGMEAGMAMGMNGCGIMHHEDLGEQTITLTLIQPRLTNRTDTPFYRRRRLCLEARLFQPHRQVHSIACGRETISLLEGTRILRGTY
jgi:hypothetical protein